MTSSAITYQTFTDLADHEEVVDGVRKALRDIEDYDGVAALSEAFVRGVSEPRVHRHVVALSGDEVVGVLGIDTDLVVELGVVPSRRHQGVATRMFEVLRDSLGVEGAIEVWAHGDGAAAQWFVERLDARRTRELLKMSVACAPGSSRAEEFQRGEAKARRVCEEQGIEVLTYSEALEWFGQDAVDSEWVRVNNEAFAWHPEQGGWDVERLRSARDTGWFDPDGVLMAWYFDENAGMDRVGVEKRQQDGGAHAELGGESADGGVYRCVGFHWTKFAVDQREKGAGVRVGEVYVVCLADEARGRRLGSMITLLGLGSLVRQGAGEIELYVEGNNAPAVSTYNKLGFQVVHTDVVYRGLLLDG